MSSIYRVVSTLYNYEQQKESADEKCPTLYTNKNNNYLPFGVNFKFNSMSFESSLARSLGSIDGYHEGSVVLWIVCILYCGCLFCERSFLRPRKWKLHIGVDFLWSLSIIINTPNYRNFQLIVCEFGEGFHHRKILVFIVELWNACTRRFLSQPYDI